MVGKGRAREKIQIIVSFRSYLLRNRKFQTNSKKIQKIRRIPFWLHLKQKKAEKCQEREKIRGETQRKGENKIYRPVPFQPDA